MNQVASNKQYYPALDGLRGLAILMVIFLHNFGFVDYFFFGWLGVDLFFVLSGFLITDLLLRNINQPRLLVNFYVRRTLRIFPIYYIIIFICLYLLPSLRNFDFSYYITNQIWLWSYLQNWLFVFKPPYGDKILLHTWSLAVEEQFYLIWPIIVLLIKNKKILLLITSIFLIAVSSSRFILWSYQVQNLLYASLYTFTRIDGLCIGCIVAILFQIDRNLLSRYTSAIIILIAGINFGFYFINTRQDFTLPYLAFVGYTTFAIIFGILVYEAVIGQTKIIKMLFENGFMKFFGKISYGLYVYHWPIYLLLFPRVEVWCIQKLLASKPVAQLEAAIIVTSIAIVISLLSYQYFEKYFLKLKKKFS